MAPSAPTVLSVLVFSVLVFSVILASAAAAKQNVAKSDLVKAAVTESLVNARNVTVWATGLKTSKAATMSKKESAALKDCIQNFKDTTSQISGSLTELKHLKQNTFKFQMSNVQTWMSAALTDQDSCLNGFQDLKTSGKVTAMVTYRVQNLSKLISNALAQVNTFAASGGGY